MKPKDVKDIITMTSHPTFLFIVVTTDYYKKSIKDLPEHMCCQLAAEVPPKPVNPVQR